MNLEIISQRLPAMSERAIDAVRELETRIMGSEPVQLGTDHLIHGGMYARTICLPAGFVLTGALLKVATVLIVNGDCVAFTGDNEIRLCGFNVIPGSAGRKTAFIANTDTHMTMVFPSDAKSVADAEEQFTNEPHLLMSRRDNSGDTVTITGE
jgi:hypothetical protein